MKNFETLENLVNLANDYELDCVAEREVLADIDDDDIILDLYDDEEEEVPEYVHDDEEEIIEDVECHDRYINSFSVNFMSIIDEINNLEDKYFNESWTADLMSISTGEAFASRSREGIWDVNVSDRSSFFNRNGNYCELYIYGEDIEHYQVIAADELVEKYRSGEKLVVKIINTLTGETLATRDTLGFWEI